MLDNIPVASIIFLVSVVLIVVAYVTNDISIEDAFKFLGYSGVGSGAIGIARNGAGRGVK